VAQAFDLDRLEVNGEAIPLVQDLLVDDRFSLGVFSASQNGALAYQTGKEQSLFQLAWKDRAGKLLASIGLSDRYYPSRVEISPAGTRAAVGILDSTGVSDIWLLDLENDTRSKFTIGSGDDVDGLWSPDGSDMVYVTNSSGNTPVISKKSTIVPGEAEVIHKAVETQLNLSSWSPDGSALLATNQPLGAGGDLMLVPMAGGEHTPQPWIQTKYDEGGGQFSPDGKWVAYESNESGRYEVYVVAHPSRTGRIQVSTRGGAEPRWRADGKELFFFGDDNRLMAAQITSDGNRFDVGKVEPLFQSREVWVRGSGLRYDVSRDGLKFLIFSPAPGESPATISVMLNWPEELKGR
jgi:dipeptidyl aminopeptidase/acylaminoacyl peptidase